MINLHDKVKKILNKFRQDERVRLNDKHQYKYIYTPDQVTPKIFQTIVKEIEKLKKDETKGNGRRCICHAWDKYECGCGADWNDYGVYNKAIIDIIKRIEEK